MVLVVLVVPVPKVVPVLKAVKVKVLAEGLVTRVVAADQNPFGLQS